MFGLTDIDLAEITSVLRQFPEVNQAVVFGSRAKATHKAGSDVDIALLGQDISFSTIVRISGILNEETNMPYHFDVVDYYTISNQELVAHIDRVGVIIYEKQQIQVLHEPIAEYRKRKKPGGSC